jgi:hypothetical protein
LISFRDRMKLRSPDPVKKGPRMAGGEQRFERAMAAIDTANAQDPNTLMIRGEPTPKELGHARLISEWIEKLQPQASEALRLAARASHIRRWERRRTDFPDGRVGYLKWRRDLQVFHAEVAGRILEAEGYESGLISRVGEIIRKKNLSRDPEVQALEDALCLVFLETQYHDMAARTDRTKMIEVLRKALRRMSPQGIRCAEDLPLQEEDRALIAEAATGREES